jgi:hypothetical protein
MGITARRSLPFFNATTGRATMRTYEELVELATICARQSHVTTSERVAVEFWRMAQEYQKEAAGLSGGELPDIGEPPSVVR